ncbi:unnamed protein product [Symbiodinium sp. CCMP2456]|nr:unnamed protein product [Symbiodinium sp. CCMP2456]
MAEQSAEKKLRQEVRVERGKIEACSHRVANERLQEAEEAVDVMCMRIQELKSDATERQARMSREHTSEADSLQNDPKVCQHWSAPARMSSAEWNVFDVRLESTHAVCILAAFLDCAVTQEMKAEVASARVPSTFSIFSELPLMRKAVEEAEAAKREARMQMSSVSRIPITVKQHFGERALCTHSSMVMQISKMLSLTMLLGCFGAVQAESQVGQDPRMMRYEARVDANGEAQDFVPVPDHSAHHRVRNQAALLAGDQTPPAPAAPATTTLFPQNPKGPLAIDDNAWTLLFKAKLGALFPVLILFMLTFCLLALSSCMFFKAKKAEGDEAEELKAQACGPEGLEEDLYGLAIASIVRDTRSFCRGYSSAGLMIARMGVSVMILVLVLILQIYLMAELKALVTSVAVNQIRSVYDRYEIIMYGNDTARMARTANGFHRGREPYFDPQNFEKLDEEDKEQVCQIPLSQPTFFMTLLTIWTFTVVADIRKAIDTWVRIVRITPTIDSMKDSMEQAEGSDEEFVIIGLTAPVKITLSIVLFLPRLVVDIYLLWLGCRWLTATPSFEDVILNAVALEFILVLNNVIFSTVVPLQSVVVTLQSTASRELHASINGHIGVAAVCGSKQVQSGWGPFASFRAAETEVYFLKPMAPGAQTEIVDVVAAKQEGPQPDLAEGQGTAPKDGIDLEMSRSEATEDLGKPAEQPPVRLMCLVMLSMFQGYASMVGPLQSAYKHKLGISTDGTAAAHAFTQAAVGVHYGKLIARLGHNVIFACLSPWTRVVIAMCFMFLGVTIPTFLVFTLGWDWVGSVFIAYMLSGLGLGIFEVTFLSVITPLGRATKAWAIVGCPMGFATINILGLTASSFGVEMVYIFYYILACLPIGMALFCRLAPRGSTELKTANFSASLLQARRWMPGMIPFFAAQFLSHFAMENWPAIFYMFHPPMVPLFDPHSEQHLMKWGQFFAVTYVFIFLGDSISRRIAIYMSTPSLRRRLAYLGVAMALIGIGLYLESLAIAIVIPVAIFLVFWGNGTIYGLTANHVDKHIPSEHNLASYSFWCFVGDLGAILGGILVDNTHEVQPTAKSVLAAFAWGIGSMIWVLLYMYLLQAVLPQYRWDARR